MSIAIQKGDLVCNTRPASNSNQMYKQCAIFNDKFYNNGTAFNSWLAWPPTATASLNCTAATTSYHQADCVAMLTLLQGRNFGIPAACQDIIDNLL